MVGRPPKYSSDEERRKADAERKRAKRAEEKVDPSLPVKDIAAEETTSPPQDADEALLEGFEKVPRPLISLKDYVAEVEREAAAYADSIGEDDKPHLYTKDLIISNRRSDRIARAGAYARWRYQSFLDGETKSL